MPISAFNVSGPAHIYYAPSYYLPPVRGAANINPGTGANAIYLGTCEVAPEPQMEFNWKDIFNSIGGEMVPSDRLYLGEDDLIIMSMNRFSYESLFGLIGIGSEDRLDRGSMMVSNNASVQLWVKFDFYGTNNALAYPEMPAGYFWWAANIRRHWPQRLTLDATNVLLIMQAQPVYNPTTRGWDLRSSLPAFFANLPAPT